MEYPLNNYTNAKMHLVTISDNYSIFALHISTVTHLINERNAIKSFFIPRIAIAQLGYSVSGVYIRYPVADSKLQIKLIKWP